MEAITHRINYRSRKNIFKLYPLGDIHAGTIYCSEDKIKAQVKAIAEDPFALWIGMGDYADLVTPKDPRWECHTIAPWVRFSNTAEDQCRWVQKLFEPIKDKCIGLLCGNHELSIRKHNHYDFMINLTERLGVKYLTYSCFVRLSFKRPHGETSVFEGYFTHGSGGPQTWGGKMMNLKKSFDAFGGDILVKGHIHDVIIKEQSFLRITKADPPIVRDRNRCGAISGSWFKTYMQGVESSYGEEKCYEPTPIGCPVFTIDPDKELINVFSNTNMMLKRLSGV